MLVYMCMYDVKQPYKWCFPPATAFAPGIYILQAHVQAFSFPTLRIRHQPDYTLTT